MVIPVGLLWFDNHKKKSMQEKIQEAACHYREKFGQWPDTCHVSPSESDSEDSVVQLDNGNVIDISALPTVLRFHFWIGESEECPHSTS